MAQQTLTVVLDDQGTPSAAESAAAAAVDTIQGAGVLVVAATFGGSSLLPTPEEALRSAIDELAALAGKGTPPKPAELQAAVDKVDRAAQVVESAAAAAPAPAPAPAPGGFALPDEPAPAPAPVDAAPAPADPTAAPVG